MVTRCETSAAIGKGATDCRSLDAQTAIITHNECHITACYIMMEICMTKVDLAYAKLIILSNRPTTVVHVIWGHPKLSRLLFKLWIPWCMMQLAAIKYVHKLSGLCGCLMLYKWKKNKKNPEFIQQYQSKEAYLFACIFLGCLAIQKAQRHVFTRLQWWGRLLLFQNSSPQLTTKISDYSFKDLWMICCTCTCYVLSHWLVLTQETIYLRKMRSDTMTKALSISVMRFYISCPFSFSKLLHSILESSERVSGPLTQSRRHSELQSKFFKFFPFSAISHMLNHNQFNDVMVCTCKTAFNNVFTAETKNKSS